MVEFYVEPNTTTIPLGRQGENLARTIYFELSELISNYGEGTATLVYLRSKDSAPYVCDTTQSGNMLSWTPTDTDTAYAGAGKCELRWSVGEVLAKSIVYNTVIAPSISGDSVVPSEYESWYEALLEHISEYEIASDQIEANTRNIATNTNDIAVLDGRVDEITTLPEGSTTGDAELADIRVGADGTQYENAGTAVRTQINDVKKDLGEQSPIWVDGYAIQSTSGGPALAEGHSYATFSVTEGCIVKGYTRGGAGASRGCAFYDADGVYISGEYNSVSGTYDWNYEIAVPDGARIFKITCNTSYKESFTFTLSNIVNGLLEARTQIDTNTNDLSKVFSNYSKVNIINGFLYASISSTSVSSESVAKNQISFYFPVEAGKIYTVDKKITTSLMRIAYSESEPAYLTPVSNYENLGATGTYKTFTAPVDGYAIIYVYNRSNDGDDKFEPILYNTVAYEYAYVPEVAQDSVELTSVVNLPHIFYCGSSRKYVKLKDAIEAAEQYMDSILYVDAGTYDLVDEFGSEFFESLTASSTLSGIVLKNRIHIIFSPNSKVVSHYAGSNQYALSLYSPFNAGPYGFTLENLTLECSRCRYALHDERNGNVEQYKSEFINCSMQIDNSNNSQWSPRHCIGGGLGSNAEIIVDNCCFKTDLSSDRGGVYYHQSNASGNKSFKSLVTVKDCYFETGTITFSDSRTDSTADKTIYIATNNSISQKYAGTDAQGIYTQDMTNPNSVVRAWNNISRS